MGFHQAEAIQNYQNLVLVASAIFGGGDKGATKHSTAPVMRNKDELTRAFNGIFGNG